MSLEILETGLLTSIQDEGRPGLAHLGISQGGAADPLSYEIGNLLVGNPRGAAAIEMTLKGGSFRFHDKRSFAVTGSDFRATLDDQAIPCWETCHARAGQTLRFGLTAEGARAYLAIGGGIAVPAVQRSRSTLLCAGLGGLGRALQRGDLLPLGESSTDARFRSLLRVSHSSECTVLVTRGTDWENVPDNVRTLFFESEFTITDQANRSGIRLDGHSHSLAQSLALSLGTAGGERLTEGVSWGTVQLPPSGKPILLMNEQATTGGYLKLARAITRDRPVLGQLKPRDRLRFSLVNAEEAVELLRAQRQALSGALVPLR